VLVLMLNLNVSKGCSYPWSSIMKALSALRSGFSIQIGDGSSSPWFEPWLYGDTLYNGVEDIHDRNFHLRVYDVYLDGEWHLDVLTTSILDDILDKLPILFLEYTMSDTITWSHSSFGEYDTKSAYVWLNRELAGHFTSAEYWSWLWKTKLLENIKHFLWPTYKGSLLTNFFRFTQHISFDSSCFRCGAATKT